MFRNRLYYRVKPLIPWSVRMAVRRHFAQRKRARVAGVWPIVPGSERPPAGWPGWPDGKQFAFVLTHDVEGPDGVAKVRPLAELEMSLGFRSCFNFIPEGPYRVPAELRAWLTGNGFEVGVHDLRHDGNLFRNRRHFASQAARINTHVKEWGASGFRAGFMLSESEWLHDLNIRYDCSTFDTDPFEPQPYGQNTIFPFWVPAPEASPSSDSQSPNSHLLAPNSHADRPSPASPRGGYVELPYTLPQDSTLFLLLNERTPQIWLKKLDWIAARSGMALVNVHPDYLHFGDGPPSQRTYPVEHYVTLLRHVRSLSAAPSAIRPPLSDGQASASQLSAFSSQLSKAPSSCWQPLPREVANFVTSLNPVPIRRKSRRVCMVTHSYYNTDGRVTRYAEALAARGDEVDVFSLRSGPGMDRREMMTGVNVHRIQDRFGKRERSQVSFILPVLRFFVVASCWITRTHARQRYDLVHVHNIPDFLVFAAWYPKLTGARVILDIHDVVPEFYASKFGVGRSRVVLPLLNLMERWSARFAHHVIIANDLWVQKYAARTRANGKCSVFINNVDECIFAARPRTRSDDRIIIMFPGGLQWHQGLDIAIHAFRRLLDHTPGAEFHIYGDGNMKETLVHLTRTLGLNGSVRFFDPLPVRDIASIMANADLGIVPKRADSFGNEAYSTKIMEFMSLRVPVVVSSTKIDRFYFDDSVVRFFESGNPDAMAAAMTEVLSDRNRRDQMVARASEYAARHSWESRKSDYLNLVDRLCAQ